jgi:U3 small nucleolar RNA-associated protein 7
MDALLSSAGPIPPASIASSSSKPFKKRKPLAHQTVNRGENKEQIDPSLHSILPNTRISASLHSSHADIKPTASVHKIGDKKLRAKVASEQVAQKRSRLERLEAQEYLHNTGQDGGIEVEEGEGERTWRVGQKEIVESVGIAVAGQKFDLKLPVVGGGGYRMDYTRNGRCVAAHSFLSIVIRSLIHQPLPSFFPQTSSTRSTSRTYLHIRLASR